MAKKRLFVFGCSFTNYIWPTWANILGKEFDYFENWGMAGCGNQFIFSSLNECILRNNISKDDTVIIMWTSIVREDRYIKGQWIAEGNIYNQANGFYDDYFVANCTDNRGYLIRDLSFVHSAKKMLEQIGAKHVFLSMVPFTNVHDHKLLPADNVDDILELYKETVDFIRPSVYEVIFKFDWWSREFCPQGLKEKYKELSGTDWPSYEIFVKKIFSNLKQSVLEEIEQYNLIDRLHESKRIDMHPTPLEYLEYIDSQLQDFIISKSTRDWVKEIDSRLQQGLDIGKWPDRYPVRF